VTPDEKEDVGEVSLAGGRLSSVDHGHDLLGQHRCEGIRASLAKKRSSAYMTRYSWVGRLTRRASDCRSR
jgi:hypothetical protein